jgi:hypothetical protein
MHLLMSFHLEGNSAFSNATPLKICGSNDGLPEEEIQICLSSRQNLHAEFNRSWIIGGNVCRHMVHREPITLHIGDNSRNTIQIKLH